MFTKKFTLTGDDSGVTDFDDLADLVGLGDLLGDFDPTREGGSLDVPQDGPVDGLRSPSLLMSSSRLSSTVSPSMKELTRAVHVQDNLPDSSLNIT